MSKSGRIWSAEGNFRAKTGGMWAILGGLGVREMMVVAGGVRVDGCTEIHFGLGHSNKVVKWVVARDMPRPKAAEAWHTKHGHPAHHS